jgi:hypothetical protein
MTSTVLTAIAISYDVDPAPARLERSVKCKPTVIDLRFLNLLHLYLDNSFRAGFAVTFLSARNLGARVDCSHFVWVICILEFLSGESFVDSPSSAIGE